MARPSDIGEPRDRFLRVRLAPSEIAAIDRARGGVTRSDFVRGVVNAAVQSRSKK